jgi:enamine deaminase RidA (YjgF/YER057c/UK114 family)
MERQRRAGLELTRSGERGDCLLDLTLHPLAGEGLEGMLRRLDAVLREEGAVPVLQLAFGALETLRGGELLMRQVFGDRRCPTTWVDGAGAPGGGLGGIQVLAVSERPVTRVVLGDRTVASVFGDGPTRHCLVGGLGDAAPAAPRADQARLAIEGLGTLLRSQGFLLGEVVRTWFYLDDILSWYDDFNGVRTSIYAGHRFRLGTLPASTGVSGRNPAGSALALAAWAVRPASAVDYPAAEVLSPLQGPAASYGSAFSRAVEIALARGRRLLVSGTASIDADGATAWAGDVGRQIGLTMEVVEAVLASRGMSLDDAARSTLYFRRPEHAAAFSAWCARHDRTLPSGLAIRADICRGDLLFEIELDAVASRRPGPAA